MAKVICSLPNASGLINGVQFVSHKLGVISEEISDDVADGFTAIPGYVLADKKGKPVEDPAPPAAPATPATPTPPAGQ